MEDDDTTHEGVMPAPIDVREGLENRRQRAMVEAALFDEPVGPVKIGRFTVIRRLGAGGMGVVYMAYDEQLDRRVAVKLLTGSGDDDTEARVRLQREARAMARLAHPNVVAVHEVGIYEGQVFVAMEYVEGGDLRSWLRRHERSWADVLAHFIQAGRGLAAAHDAGLVHRDFKPDNVLVGEDGRVRVADFGLARGRGAETATEPTTDPAPGSGLESADRLSHPLTATGAILGTPAYMAPEQVRGEPADARVDQFGFCVALYEGLYGQRPFAGETFAALWAAVEAGRVDEPPEGSNVPAWLRAAVVRGLSPRADDRWPSMPALLEVLSNDPQARRRRRVRRASIAGLVLTVLAGSGGLVTDQVQRAARQRFWAALSERRMEIQQHLENRKAEDEAIRARNSARMSAAARVQPAVTPKVDEDPTVAAALLRDVEGDARASARWIGLANLTLGRPISTAVLTDHLEVVNGLSFGPSDTPVLYSASGDGTVRRWTMGAGTTELIARHELPITRIALGPQGKTLAWGSSDHRVGVWSTEEPPGTPPHILEGHQGSIRSVSFDATESRIVSTSDDHTARIWRVETGSSVVLRGHTAAVTAAAFDPAGARVVTTSKDKTARVWRASDGTELAQLVGHDNAVFHVRFIDGDRVITAADDGTARLWTLDDERPVNSEVLIPHDSAVTSLDARGGRFSTTHLDGTARIFELGGGTPVVLSGHTAAAWRGLILPEGRGMVTAGFDHALRVTPIDGRGPSQALPGHRMRLSSVAVHPSGRWLASGSYDGHVRVWDLQQPRTQWVLRGHQDVVWAAAVDGPNRRLVTASHDGTARTWDLDSGAARTTLEPDDARADPLNSIALSPDGRTLVVGSSRGMLRTRTTDTGAIRTWSPHDGAVWDLAFDPTGKRIASASFDGTTRIWAVADDRLLHVLGEDQGHAAVSKVRWSPEGRHLYTVDYEGMLRVWEAATGRLLVARRAHDDRIVDLASSPDGKTLATASHDRRAKIWPDPESQPPVELVGHTNVVWSVAFGPDGTQVLTTSLDGTARLWSAQDGTLQQTLAVGGGEIWDACFSNDGRWVFTAANDGKVRVHAPGRVEGALVEWSHDEPVLGLQLVPGWDRLISLSADHTARVWRTDHLAEDPALLWTRLREATTYCIPTEHRIRELGEDEVAAEAALQRCREG